ATAPGRSELGGARFRDFEQALAQFGRVAAEVVESRQRSEALEPEDALEERGRPVADGTTCLASRFGDEAALQEARDGRVRSDAADARDVGSRARAEIRHDRERLERS